MRYLLSNILLFSDVLLLDHVLPNIVEGEFIYHDFLKPQNKLIMGWDVTMK